MDKMGIRRKARRQIDKRATRKGDPRERRKASRCALTRWAILEFVHKGMAGANGRSKGQCFQ